ncbi:MAG: AMP-binding protein [Xanthomonadales bacterium]|nr:AMP-binding protein [Xanthomonadales bacterium]
MSAVVESPAPGALPLLAAADPARPVAWRQGRAVSARCFLADVARVAGALPCATSAVNLCRNRYAFLVAFAAVLARGQANLLPPSRAAHAVDEALAANPGSYALSDGGEEAPGPRHFTLPPLDGEVATGGLAAAVPGIAAGQVAAIGFTSGSTGQPRGNPKTWRAFSASTALNAGALAATLELAGGQHAHVVATVPPQHMYGIELSVLLPLLGPFAVSDRKPLFPADIAAALAELPAPRVLVTTPVHLKALMAAGIALPPLGAIVSATAPLAADLAAAAEARHGARVLELFGSTETCVIAQRRAALGGDWTLYPGVTLRPQPDGTAVDTAWFEREVVLPDVVELGPGGTFALRGRQADLVEIAGKRASLADLTRRVQALAGVEDAVVFQSGTADAFGVRRIAALVVAPGRSEAQLIGELRQAIDAAFLPRPLRKVAALPRNETGKLPRAALLAELERSA